VDAAADADAAAARQADATRFEARLHDREETLDARAAELAERERRLGEKETQIAEIREKTVRQLERTSGLPASQAKALLMKELEDQVRHESARRLRAIEEETKRDAERRVRNILSVVMQRLAAGHAAETTVSVVQLQADDMKGRIIGREGRNIRALEHLTGVDFIIDDTPNAVILSGARSRGSRWRSCSRTGASTRPGSRRPTTRPSPSSRATSLSRASRRASTPTSRASTPSSRRSSGASSTARRTARTCSRTRSSAPTSRR
jgi:hypothetical protein